MRFYDKEPPSGEKGDGTDVLAVGHCLGYVLAVEHCLGDVACVGLETVCFYICSWLREFNV